MVQLPDGTILITPSSSANGDTKRHYIFALNSETNALSLWTELSKVSLNSGTIGGNGAQLSGQDNLTCMKMYYHDGYVYYFGGYAMTFTLKINASDPSDQQLFTSNSYSTNRGGVICGGQIWFIDNNGTRIKRMELDGSNIETYIERKSPHQFGAIACANDRLYVMNINQAAIGIAHTGYFVWEIVPQAVAPGGVLDDNYLFHTFTTPLKFQNGPFGHFGTSSPAAHCLVDAHSGCMYIRNDWGTDNYDGTASNTWSILKLDLTTKTETSYSPGNEYNSTVRGLGGLGSMMITDDAFYWTFHTDAEPSGKSWDGKLMKYMIHGA
jgi:hypothetical protein